mmetsp:Transcript_24686/g.77399  ORF Transcript_24686/g.77399 Transcript_24686/m.77399 type:complete len:270 (+) Transcript_24686:592-1401(+)
MLIPVPRPRIFRARATSHLSSALSAALRLEGEMDCLSRPCNAFSRLAHISSRVSAHSSVVALTSAVAAPSARTPLSMGSSSRVTVVTASSSLTRVSPSGSALRGTAALQKGKSSAGRASHARPTIFCCSAREPEPRPRQNTAGRYHGWMESSAETPNFETAAPCEVACSPSSAFSSSPMTSPSSTGMNLAASADAKASPPAERKCSGRPLGRRGAPRRPSALTTSTGMSSTARSLAVPRRCGVVFTPWRRPRASIFCAAARWYSARWQT